MILEEALLLFSRCRKLNIGCEIIFDRSENIKVSIPRRSLRPFYENLVVIAAKEFELTVETYDTNLLIY